MNGGDNNTNNIICTICKNNMISYYKNFNIILSYCYDCCHFKGHVLENDHNTMIFKDINKYKHMITSDEFYKKYYDINSYFILHFKDFQKLTKYINFNQIVYFICESFSNIQKAKKGEYDFFSTNSIKYASSLVGYDLVNIYVLTNSNKTIYEFVPLKLSLHYNLSRNIYDSLYNEIINNVYIP